MCVCVCIRCICMLMQFLSILTSLATTTTSTTSTTTAYTPPRKHPTGGYSLASYSSLEYLLLPLVSLLHYLSSLFLSLHKNLHTLLFFSPLPPPRIHPELIDCVELFSEPVWMSLRIFLHLPRNDRRLSLSFFLSLSVSHSFFLISLFLFFPIVLF